MVHVSQTAFFDKKFKGDWFKRVKKASAKTTDSLLPSLQKER